MPAVVARSLAALAEPFRAARDAQERRQRVTDEALRSLPYSATDAEKVNAADAIRETLARLDGSADVCKIRVAAEGAVQPIREAAARRILNARLLAWAVGQLPYGKTDRDDARVRRECTEILAELPPDLTEVEGKEALESTVAEARREIEARQAKAERQARKAQLVAEGVAEVGRYLLELYRENEVTRDVCLGGEITRKMEAAARRRLEVALTGDESSTAVRMQVREIVDTRIP